MKWMKVALATALLTWICQAQTHPELARTPEYSITIAAVDQSLTVGKPINIQVSVKNITDKDIWWRAEFGDTAYKAFQFSFTKNGRDVGTTFFHRKVKGKQRDGDPEQVSGGGSVVSALAPGKSVTFTLDLRRLYEITEPGDYMLEVSREAEDGKRVIRSNTLRLTIGP
jgi:hypothetical protein